MKALPMFFSMHPDCIGVFLVHNTTNRGVFAADALNPNKMNLNSGGKQALLRNGWYVDNGILIEQSMVYPQGHMNTGLRKGIRQVLLECNLLPQGMKHLYSCRFQCKNLHTDMIRM
jgi:hypothetical protein